MWLEAGPFTARLAAGRELFSAVEVGLDPATLTLVEGPSGSGKSTLLRQLVGLEPAADARRRLGGEDYPERDLPRWRSRVTLLAQDAPMIPGSVAANLELGLAHRHGRDRSLDPERRRELLARTGLGELDPERDVATLSGGERHRLALVRGLLWDPPVLVADEPLSGLDPEVAEACFSLLEEQSRRPHRAVVLILHDPVRATRVSHRISVGRRP